MTSHGHTRQQKEQTDTARDEEEKRGIQKETMVNLRRNVRTRSRPKLSKARLALGWQERKETNGNAELEERGFDPGRHSKSRLDLGWWEQKDMNKSLE